MVHVDSPSPSSRKALALNKTLEIGAICNNASAVRNEYGVYIGQSTDVALLNVLPAFGMPDQRQVCYLV